MPTTQESLPVNAVEVCSRAMVLVGLERLSSFNEVERDEVLVASQIYELIVADCLTAFPWDHCRGQQLLEHDAAPPLDRFESAWHMPVHPTGQPLYIQTVRVGDHPIVYEIMGERIYCNADPADEVIAEYLYRVAEARWPPAFMLLVVERLAERLALSVTRQPGQIKAQGEAAERQQARARTRMSQQHTTGGLRPSRFTRFRRRGAGLPGNVAG